MIQNKAYEILMDAVNSKTYDIFFSPLGEEYQVYFRKMSGRILVEKMDLLMGKALISHFKFLAGMNTEERRRTQLGSCWYALKSSKVRLRLSSVGDFKGYETLVIRILQSENEKLLFWFDGEEKLEHLYSARGLYLFSGPVGSGKTSLMMDLARKQFSSQQVITIEDPVELVESTFTQLQVNEVIGNSYDELIKLSLRHRPDLLIVGEIRDQQTARAVLRASLTGHTVFSTVHARSISGVWSRLLELGLTDGELKQSLQAIVYQRLLAGKGVIDIAKTGFKSWSTENWNQKMDNLFTQGYLTANEVQAEKIEFESTSQIDSTDGESFV